MLRLMRDGERPRPPNCGTGRVPLPALWRWIARWKRPCAVTPTLYPRASLAVVPRRASKPASARRVRPLLVVRAMRAAGESGLSGPSPPRLTVGYHLTGRPSMATQCRQIEPPVKADTLATPKSNEPTAPFTGQRNLKPHGARRANTSILGRRCVVCPSQVRVRGLFTTQEDDVWSRVAYKVGIAANDMRRLHVMLRVLQPKSQVAVERAHAAAVVGERDLGRDVPKPSSPILERNRHIRRVATRDHTSRRHNSSTYDGCGNQRNKDSQCGAKAAEPDVHVIENISLPRLGARAQCRARQCIAVASWRKDDTLDG